MLLATGPYSRDELHAKRDLPHGKFSREVRRGYDGLYGLSGADPVGYTALCVFLVGTGRNDDVERLARGYARQGLGADAILEYLLLDIAACGDDDEAWWSLLLAEGAE